MQRHPVLMGWWNKYENGHATKSHLQVDRSIPIKIPFSFFTEMEKKYYIEPQIAKTILSKKYNGELPFQTSRYITDL